MISRRDAYAKKVRRREKFAKSMLWVASIVTIGMLISIIGYILFKGFVSDKRSEYEIINLFTLLIAEEQPVARDLRIIINAMRTSHSLGRMADNAVHISKSTITLTEQEYLKPLVQLPRMAEITVGMVKDAIDVFINPNEERAREIALRDKKVDTFYASIFKDLLSLMHEDTEKIEQCMILLFICRRLERVADHTTHICEGAVYVETGEHVYLNQ